MLILMLFIETSSTQKGSITRQLYASLVLPLGLVNFLDGLVTLR